MAGGGKIGFVKSGSFSYINESVERQLRRNFSGAEIVVFEIKDLLRRSPLFLLRALFQAARIHQFKVCGDPLDSVIQTPLAFALIKRQLERLVRAPEFLFTFQTQSMWDAAVPGIPNFVYTDHTELANKTYPDFDLRLLKGPWWTTLEKQIYANSSLTFTMSSHVTRSVIEDYGCSARKVVRVGAGANAPVGTFSPPDPERYRRKEILFVGTDWERKGGPQLEAAFRMVLSSLPEARLIIAGCSPELKLPNCDVLGRVSLAEVGRLYRRASLFCLPTRNEPFGIVFVEAMLAGLPVVATDVGAVADLIENGYNGQRIQVDDIEGLATALISLLADAEKLELLGKNSDRTAQASHTWDQVGYRIKAAIESSIHLPTGNTSESFQSCAS